jgi:uncharacterized protein
MPLTFNIRHLEHQDQRLCGHLPSGEMDLGGIDELIQAGSDLEHDLLVQQHESSILVQGSLKMSLRCECVRCLRPFTYWIHFREWSCLLPLEGEDKVVINNDCVDLTAYLREDIVLAFPQHPLCEPECRGLSKAQSFNSEQSSGAGQTDRMSSAWAALDKLKI